MRTYILALLLAMASMAQAQRFSFGLKGGTPVTDALPYGGGSADFNLQVDTGRWTVGPTAEFRLFGNLSIEADALYRGYRFEESSAFLGIIGSGLSTVQVSNTAPFYSSFRQKAKEWDFPVLAKYRFRAGTMRPFVDLGVVFAHVSSDFTSSLICLASTDTCTAAGISQYMRAPTTVESAVNRRGPSGGVGVEFQYRRVKIAPELRYMRLTRPNVNEATVMVGFTF